jgi:hypothetical protein
MFRISTFSPYLHSSPQTYTTIDPKKYPYVLGYGITQKIPHPVTGTPAFYPAKFYFSTTPDTDSHTDSHTDSSGQATLNFCIINGDNDHDEKLVDPDINPSAGILSQPLIDLTLANNLNSDGILGMSDNIFFKHWIVPNIFDGLGGTNPGSALNVPLVSHNSTNTGGNGSRHANQYSDWESDWVLLDDEFQRVKNSGEEDVSLFPHLLIFS